MSIYPGPGPEPGDYERVLQRPWPRADEEPNWENQIAMPLMEFRHEEEEESVSSLTQDFASMLDFLDDEEEPNLPDADADAVQADDDDDDYSGYGNDQNQPVSVRCNQVLQNRWGPWRHTPNNQDLQVQGRRPSPNHWGPVPPPPPPPDRWVSPPPPPPPPYHWVSPRPSRTLPLTRSRQRPAQHFLAVHDNPFFNGDNSIKYKVFSKHSLPTSGTSFCQGCLTTRATWL